MFQMAVFFVIESKSLAWTIFDKLKKILNRLVIESRGIAKKYTYNTTLTDAKKNEIAQSAGINLQIMMFIA
jgi:hypothetical protein